MGCEALFRIQATQESLHAIATQAGMLFDGRCVLLPFNGNLVERPIPWVLLSTRVGIKSNPATLKLAAATAAKSLQSCPTLCNPIDGSPPGSRVPGILQARTLEWGAIAFSALKLR